MSNNEYMPGDLIVHNGLVWTCSLCHRTNFEKTQVEHREDCPFSDSDCVGVKLKKIYKPDGRRKSTGHVFEWRVHKKFAKNLIAYFEKHGSTVHSAQGATLGLLLEHCIRNRIPFKLQGHKDGYFLRKDETALVCMNCDARADCPHVGVPDRTATPLGEMICGE